MNKRSFLRPSLFNALSVILPTAEETLLLRACLSSGKSAPTAWKEWQRRRNGLEAGFLGTNEAVKKLRLLVFNAVRLYGLELDKESQTYLRSAFLKEELRGKIFRRVCRDILLFANNEGIPTVVLKGTALAETVYGNPVLRHCHDIDILIRDQDMSRAVSLLHVIGFKKIKPKAEARTVNCKLEHESGLPLNLHTRPFELPYYNALFEEMWERSQSHVIAGVQAKILAPSDNLLHVCGHAFYGSGRESLHWVSDAWFIIARCRDLDWDLLLDCAQRSHLALGLWLTLGYLAEDLSAPIPSRFLDRLFAAALKSNVTERELALFGARSAQQGRVMNLFRKAGDWRERAFLIQWLFLPSPTYLLLIEKVRPSWLLPFYYVYRLLRDGSARLCAKFPRVRRIKWRIDRFFLQMNFRTP
jgi:hypothetical protein